MELGFTTGYTKVLGNSGLVSNLFDGVRFHHMVYHGSNSKLASKLSLCAIITSPSDSRHYFV
jgi:hypothetical protein